MLFIDNQLQSTKVDNQIENKKEQHCNWVPSRNEVTFYPVGGGGHCLEGSAKK